MTLNIDYLTLTIKPQKKPHIECINNDNDDVKIVATEKQFTDFIFRFFGLNKIQRDFVDIGHVKYYEKCYRFSGISIKIPDWFSFDLQGCCIEFSGQGISFYEQYIKKYNPKFSWSEFMKNWFTLAFEGFTPKITRIDLAYDDISKSEKNSDWLLDMEKIEKCLKKREFVSLFRCDENPYIDLNKHEKRKRGEIVGCTINVGNRKSNSFCRFYDKLAEQKQTKNVDLSDDIKHWTRMEFEFKNERAMSICQSMYMLTDDEFQYHMSMVINRYIRFVVLKNNDTNHNYRCNSKRWWLNVVHTVRTTGLTQNKSFKNRYRRVMNWINRSVAPDLFAILSVMPLDKFLQNIILNGASRQKYEQEMIKRDLVYNPDDEKTDYFTPFELTSNDREYMLKILRENYDKTYFKLISNYMHDNFNYGGVDEQIELMHRELPKFNEMNIDITYNMNMLINGYMK